MNGFTLIEILVVLTIIAILGILGFINYGTFSSTQLLNEGTSLVQSILRTASANATAGYKCQGLGGATWIVSFENDKKTINLKCKVGVTTNTPRTYPIPTKIEVSSIANCSAGTCTCSVTSYPFSVSFTPLFGVITFEEAGGPSCVSNPSQSTFYIRLINTETNATKDVSISKGGGIDEYK